MTALHKFATRYAVELLFAQLIAIALNVFSAFLFFAKLLGACA